MTSWLFENPVPIAVLMAVIAAILAWRSRAGGGRRELAAAGVCALVGLAAIVVKLLLAGALVAAVEVFLAKLRLFRVPELLAGSFVLAFLSVTASSLVG